MLEVVLIESVVPHAEVPVFSFSNTPGAMLLLLDAFQKTCFASLTLPTGQSDLNTSLSLICMGGSRGGGGLDG